MESIFKNKKILLGVTASIAAYKSPLIVRELIKLGAHVNVIMTPSAKNFVTPMTLTNVSRNPVAVEMFDKDLQDSGAWHIQLAHWADLALIAPCSATTLGKLANGICDNALTTVITALPRELPLLIAPSMDSTMWLNPSTQRNIRQMQADGALIIPPGEGELSSGIIGPGRLPDISVVIDYVYRALKGWVYEEHSERVFMQDSSIIPSPPKVINDNHDADKLNAAIQLEQMKKTIAEKNQPQTLKGKKVVITAGPTHEKIDDVRFLGNHSSGKMGYAIATSARNAGANVVLVSGPVSINPPEGVTTINVYTAQEMYDATVVEFPDADIGIMCAAVADYTLKKPFDGKLKKSETGPELTLQLVETQDILASLGKKKKKNQTLVGFALEAVNEIEYGREKLKSKNADMIVVNSASRPQSGFGIDMNTITLLIKGAGETQYPPMSKTECAKIIIDKTAELHNK